MLKIFFFFHSWLFQHYLGTYLGSKKIKFCTWTFFPLFQTHFIAWILHSYRNRWFDMCTSISCKKRGENCALSFYCFSSVLFFLMIYKSIFVFFRVVLYREIGRWPKRLGSNVSYTRDRIQPYSGAKFQTKTCFFEIINYFYGLYWIQWFAQQ